MRCCSASRRATCQSFRRATRQTLPCICRSTRAILSALGVGSASGIAPGSAGGLNQRDDDQRWIDKLDQRSEADYFVPRALGKLCQLRARVVSVLGADCAMRVPDGGRSGYIAGVSDSPFLWGTDGARWVQPVEIKTNQQSIVRVHGSASNQQPSKRSKGQHDLGG